MKLQGLWHSWEDGEKIQWIWPALGEDGNDMNRLRALGSMAVKAGIHLWKEKLSLQCQVNQAERMQSACKLFLLA